MIHEKKQRTAVDAYAALDAELRVTTYASREDAVAAYINHMGPLKEVSVWLEPKRCVQLKVPEIAPPKVIISRLVRQRDGSYLAMPLQWPMLVKLNKKEKYLNAWGLKTSMRTVERLCRAGFVRSAQLTPFFLLVDMESLWEHLNRTAGEDGALFWTQERRRKYSEAIANSNHTLGEEEE